MEIPPPSVKGVTLWDCGGGEGGGCEQEGGQKSADKGEDRYPGNIPLRRHMVWALSVLIKGSLSIGPSPVPPPFVQELGRDPQLPYDWN